MSEGQGKRRIVVLPFLAECVGQAGEAVNLRPHREVLSFNV